MLPSTSSMAATRCLHSSASACSAVTARHSIASTSSAAVMATTKRNMGSSAKHPAPSLTTTSSSSMPPPPPPPPPRAAVVRSQIPLVRPSRRTTGPTQARAAARGVQPSADPHFIAQQLLRTSWLDPHDARKRELRQKLHERQAGLGAGVMPDWLAHEYELCRTYRAARSRLWLPTAEEIRSASNKSDTVVPLEGSASTPQAWLDETLDAVLSKLAPVDAEAWELSPIEERQDLALRSIWRAMSDREREQASSRARYECVRRLGWRKGFSSGFPAPQAELLHPKTPTLVERQTALAAMRQEVQAGNEASSSLTSTVLDARDTLLRLEHEEAWAAWQALSAEQRDAEEQAAWKLRDRGNIYLSGGRLSGAGGYAPAGEEVTTHVLGAPGARWYDAPQRAGTLQFLPNTIVRLVRNHTPAGAPYDAWKATFRVPLSMHKHGLRSYLLALYGLRTTWVRSMVYRAPGLTNPHSTRRAGKARGYGRRTWKKVEVGLLEPFVFPEISPAFRREALDGGLVGEETEMERMRSLIALRRGGRWRATRQPDPYGAHEAKSTPAQAGSFVSGPREPTEKHKKERTHASSPPPAKTLRRPVIVARKGGIPTAKHSRILELLGAKKAEREARIEGEVRSALGAAKEEAQAQADK